MSESQELMYSKHVLQCLIKFLPNNPNFCNSYKHIEEEEYFKKCKVSLLYFSISNDIGLLIDEIVTILQEKLSIFEEFNVNYIKSMDVMGPNSDIDNASNAFKKYRTCKKLSKYPIKSIGLSNYLLLFLRLLTDICDVHYTYYDNPDIKLRTKNDRKLHFDKNCNVFFGKGSKIFFKTLLFGIINKNVHFDTTNDSEINLSSRHSPSKLDFKIFRKILQVFIPLKSTHRLNRCINNIIKNDKSILPVIKTELIKGDQVENAHEKNKNTTYTDDDNHWDKLKGMKHLRNEIDLNIEYLLYYVARSNPEDYSKFLENILVTPAQLETAQPGLLKKIGNNSASYYKEDNHSKEHIFHMDPLLKGSSSSQSVNTINTSSTAAAAAAAAASSSAASTSSTSTEEEDSINAGNTHAHGSESGEHNSYVFPSFLNIYNSELLYATEYLSYASFRSIADLTNYIQLVNNLMGIIKKSIFKKCLLLGFTHSLSLWIHTKPRDYLKFTHDNQTPENNMMKKELTNLFNSLYSTFNPSSLINNVYGNSFVNTSPNSSSPSPPAQAQVLTQQQQAQFLSPTSQSSFSSSSSTVPSFSSLSHPTTLLQGSHPTDPSTCNLNESGYLSGLHTPSVTQSPICRSSSPSSIVQGSHSSTSSHSTNSSAYTPTGMDSMHASTLRGFGNSASQTPATEYSASTSDSNNGKSFSFFNMKKNDGENVYKTRSFDYIHKFLTSEECDIETNFISPYNFGYSTIRDTISDPGDLGILRCLVVLSVLNVDVFQNFLNKTSFKNFLDASDIVEGEEKELKQRQEGEDVSRDIRTDTFSFGTGAPPSSSSSSASLSMSSSLSNMTSPSNNWHGISSSQSNSNSPQPFLTNVPENDYFFPTTSSASTIQKMSNTSSGSAPSAPNTPNSFLSLQNPIPTKSLISTGNKLQQNLRKMTTSILSSSYSTNKEVRFWTHIMKYLTLSNSSSHQISDKSMILVLHSVMFMYELSSVFSAVSSQSAVVIFAKRIYNNLVKVFDYAPGVKVPQNLTLLYDALKRNPAIQSKFDIEFITPSIYLQADKFVYLINQKFSREIENGIFTKISSYNFFCMSEGMKYFFQAPMEFGDRKRLFDQSFFLLKKIAYQLSTRLFKTIDYVVDGGSDCIDSVLDGKYVSEEHDLQFYIGEPMSNSSAYFQLSKKGSPAPSFLDEETIQKMLNLRKEDLKGVSSGTKLSLNKSKKQGVQKGTVQADNTSEVGISIISNIVNVMKTATLLFQDDVLIPNKHTDFKDLVKTFLVGIMAGEKKLLKETVSCLQCVLLLDLDPTNPRFSTLYTFNGYLCLVLAIGAFSLSIPDPTKVLMLKTLEQSLQLRASFNKQLCDVGLLDKLDKQDNVIFSQLHEALGRTCFLSLCFHDVKVHATIKGLFNMYKQEIDFYCDSLHKSAAEMGIWNYEFVSSMATCNTTYGPIAFQRHIRADALKLLTVPNKGMYDSLTVYFEKWFQMSAIGYEHLSNTDQNKHRNYSGIMASGSVVFNLRNVGFLEKFPYLNECQSTVTQKADFFLRRQCELLDSPDLLSREYCKDILSVELNPIYFFILFNNLLKKLDSVITVDASGESVENFILLEQIILVVRSLMERDDIRVIALVTSTILKLVSRILELITEMKPESINQYKSMIYMSKLFLSFKHAERFLLIRGDLQLKNAWIKILLGWFSSAIFKEMDYNNLTKPHREMDLAKRDIDYLYLDTSIECTKALAYLTANIALEVPQASSEEELKRSKSVTFGNYFSVLLKALEKTADYENIPFVLRHKVLIFNEHVIICLTNLLSANADVGLDYALPIGYSENRMIRLTFLKVFVEITKSSNLKNSELNESQEELINKIIQRMITHPKLVCLVASACPVNEIELMSASLVSIFESKHVNHILISELIVDEIEKVSRPMDILRRNSIATRTLAMFSRGKGHDYLKKTIKPVLDAIIENDEDFEIEKASATPEQSAQNSMRFEKYMVMLTDRICSSVAEIPEEFVYIAQRIYTATKEKFPGSEFVAVGSFMFLRFFCPALVSPDTENIVASFVASNRRSFIVLAKVVQNIANQSVKSLKWPMIQDKKELLESCSNRIVEFLRNVSDPSNKTNISVDFDAPIARQSNLSTFHKILYNYKSDMRDVMVQNVDSNESLNDMIETFKIVDDTLLSLGQPRMEFKEEIPQFIRDNPEKYGAMHEFLNRYVLKQQNRQEEPSFAHEAIDSEGNPILVYSVKNIVDESFEMEQVIYRLLLLSSRLWFKNHSLFFDATGYSPKSYERMEYIFSLYLNLLPREVFKHHKKKVFYNIDEDSMKLLLDIEKYIRQNMQATPVDHEFLNSDCTPEIINALKLSKYSTEVYNDVRVTLHNTTLYEPLKGRFVPVTLKIGNKSFQIVKESPKRVKIKGLNEVFEVYFNNVYEIKDIISAGTSSVTGIPYELTIEMKNDVKLVMSTQKYMEILKIFYYAQAKLEDDYKDPEYEKNMQRVSFSKSIDSELDLLARMVFVIFTGLSSCDDEIKSTSYSLLCVVKQAFGLDLGHKLHNLPEVYLPDDNDVFTQVLFDNLAHTKPELTFYIWKHFLEGINNVLLDDQMVHCINCLSPWTANIYEHVYAADNLVGIEKTATIIRSLIKVTVNKKRFSNAVKYFVWSELILDSSLLTLIIDEIINHAIDRESEGADWVPCISVLTRISTVEVTGQIIQRLLRLVKSFIPALGTEQNINSWSEIYILICVVQDLAFNTSMNFEICLPELLFVISMLIDMGPSNLRVSLHRLIVNVCNAFVSNSIDGSENMRKLIQIMEPLSSPRAKILFGFTQESNFAHYYTNTSTLLSKVNYLGQLVEYLMSIMRYGSSNSECAEQWQAKYNDLIIQTIFGDSPFLSTRAMMIFSVISKDSIAPELLSKLLTVTMKITGTSEVTEESVMYLVTHLVAYGNFVKGITNNVELMVKLSWFCSTFLFSSNIALFHSSLLTTLSCFESLHDLMDPQSQTTEHIWENDRYGLGPTLRKLEALSSIEFRPDTFIHVLMQILSRAALSTHTRSSAIQGFKSMCSSFSRKSSHEGNDHLCILLFLFFMLPTTEFYTFYQSLGLPDDKVMLDENCDAPKVLLEWLLSDDDTKNLMLYQASLFASADSFEDINKVKVYNVALYVAKNKPEFFFRYMSAIISDSQLTEKHCVLLELLRKAFDLSNIALMNDRYQYISQYEKELDEKIEKMNILGIKDLGFPTTAGHIMAGIAEEVQMVYERKKYTVILLDEIMNG